MAAACHHHRPAHGGLAVPVDQPVHRRAQCSRESDDLAAPFQVIGQHVAVDGHAAEGDAGPSDVHGKGAADILSRRASFQLLQAGVGQFGHGVVRLLPAITQIPEYLVAIDRNRSHTCNTPLNRRLPVPSLAHNS